MIPAASAYLRVALAALQKVLAERSDALDAAAACFVDAIQRGGLIYVTGSGHSHMLAEEVFYRAGGLIAVYPILEPSLMLHTAAVSSSRLERVPGIAAVAVEGAGVGHDDVLIVASNSGRNAYPVEAARTARRLGAKVVALTSLRHATAVNSRDPSGQRLFEVADVVLDTGVPYGDAAVTVAGHPNPAGPLSTVVGAAMLNAVVVETIARLAAAGQAPDTWVSANIDGPGAAADIGAWSRRVPILR